MSPFEGEGKEFHSVAKEVFGKFIKLDDFYVLVPNIDVHEVHVVESID